MSPSVSTYICITICPRLVVVAPRALSSSGVFRDDRDLLPIGSVYLGEWGKMPINSTGEASSMEDVGLVLSASGSKVDATLGTALNLFRGSVKCYGEVVEWSRLGESFCPE